MTAVTLHRVWKTFGDRLVLERLNLHVHTNEFVTVVGPAGIGKSTLLHLIAGVEQPNRGLVLFDDRPLANGIGKGTNGRNTGGRSPTVVLHRKQQYPHLDLLHNVAQVAAPRGWRGFFSRWDRTLKKELTAKAEIKLSTVGLADSGSKMPQELDPETEQRLALAQSLMLEPRVLLLDEPFTRLAPDLRQNLHALLLDLWWRERMTIFLVTRDLTEGFYLGTRLVVLDKRRHDPQEPDAYGAAITYDIPVGHTDPKMLQEIAGEQRRTR